MQTCAILYVGSSATPASPTKLHFKDSLVYTCRCNSGIQPDLRPFTQSVPAQKCRFWYNKCVEAAVNNAERSACMNARDTTCGVREVGEVVNSTSSLLRASTSSSPTGSRSTLSSVASTSPSTSASNTTAPQSSRVPVATIAGTIIGAIGGVVVIISVLAYMYKQRKRRGETVKRATSPVTYEKPELHGTPAHVETAENPTLQSC
jgi:hypothetical protein